MLNEDAIEKEEEMEYNEDKASPKLAHSVI